MKSTRKATATAVVAFCMATAASKAATLQFNSSGGILTSVTFVEPIVFTTTTNYTNSGIQLRIFDLFPGVLANNVAAATTTISITVGSTPVPTTNTLTQRSSFLGGSTTAGDALWFFQGSAGYSFSTGQNVTIQGGTTLTFSGTPITIPTAGTYQAVLASQQDGSNLASPVNLIVSVPEASTSLLSMAGLLAIGLRRRR